MYDAIKQSLLEEFSPTNLDSQSLEDAYETIYRLVVRLQDMDDFSDDILKNIYKAMGGNLTADSFVKAFKQVISSEYDSTEADYFSNALNTYKEDLKEALLKAVESSSPSDSWNADINWLFNHATINVNGTDYTINQLQTILDKESE